jgi:NAD(P)-dependent dehydrogenase (short-subunit alcohol dehydrogenase family)
MSHPPVWFITGCSSGFGRAIAEAALQAGHRVIATSRDIRAITDLEKDGQCHIMTLDVTDGANVRECVADAVKVWGRVDSLVNNAGCGLLGAVEECSEADIRASMETNYFGPLNVIRELLPHFRSNGSGRIINISAAAAIANYPGFGAYGAAKAALEAVSESLQAELSPLGIHVVLVQPGPFRTDFVRRSLQKASVTLDAYERTSGRFGKLITSMDGKQPGSPEKAATAILQAAMAEKPPFRLTLGKYANEKVKKKVAALESERAAWEAVGSPTDY